jgi:PAS domain-containing protein
MRRSAGGRPAFRAAGPTASRSTLAIEVGLDEQSGWLVCTCREVAGEDLLSESQRYLDVAFEVAPVGMALFDTDGRYVRVNDALCRLLGRSKADLIGRRDQEFTQPGQRGRAS